MKDKEGKEEESVEDDNDARVESVDSFRRAWDGFGRGRGTGNVAGCRGSAECGRKLVGLSGLFAG